MTSIAPRVHTDQATIARLESLVRQLSEAERVQITLADGAVMRGLVSAMPSMQIFFDADGTEGSNALVRIEESRDECRFSDVWLDQVSDVVHLPNPTPPKPSTRLHPPDPNAPVTGETS